MQRPGQLTCGDRRGFSLMELAVVVLIIAVLIGISVPLLSKARVQGHASQCLSNLRQLVTVFEVYAQHNHDQFPDDMAAHRWDDLVLPYVGNEAIFECLDDPKHATTKLSYAWRNRFAVAQLKSSVSAMPRSNLKRMDLILLFETLADWHGPNTIQAATLDGAARAWTRTEFDQNMLLLAE